MSTRQTATNGSVQSHDAGGRTPGSTAPPQAPVELTADQFERWARLLAEGDVEFPDNLPAPQADRLLAEVRQRRRGRLVRLIAHGIAQGLSHSSDLPEMEDSRHDCDEV